jgi:cell division protein FtsI/penicillin-binding protein 2
VPEPAEARRADRLLDAVGHGKYRVTLLQLARAYAALVNGGKLQRLGVVHARKNSHGTMLPVKRPFDRVLEFPPPQLELVRAGLLAAVAADYGRAHEFAIPGLPFAGKTGGVEAPPLAGAAANASEDVDGWFVAYAPANAPKILVAVRVERKGEVAPPALVKAVLEAWRDTQ